MTDPRDLQTGDELSIDCEPFSGIVCEVSDTQVEDIGITETFAVTLVTGGEVTESNLDKLADRQERGKITGQGDDR
jgi:hypothetical protein